MSDIDRFIITLFAMTLLSVVVASSWRQAQELERIADAIERAYPETPKP